MTGLDDVDEIVEIAVVPTDENLNLLDSDTGIDLVVKPTEEGMRRLEANDFVYKMHQKSGLLELMDSGMSIQNASEEVMRYVKKFASKAHSKKVPGAMLAGNSVHVDLRFLKRYIQGFTEHLHYRIIDVSTIKELAKMWYSEAADNAPKKDSAHRALDDILESIAEMKYYREAVFK